jgi:MFS family permease
MAVTETTSTAVAGSTWAPLRSGLFRALWLASLASNIGSWMHLVAASWMMTTLTTSVVVVALLQTVNSVPNFLLALPAGALADVVDRRRLVLFSQAWQLLVAAALGLIALSGAADPVILLVMTFALATGAALGAPAFSAITPELVPRAQLPAAISLNAVVLTGSQAIGPAVGGLLVAWFGPGPVFVVNAVSFLAVVTVVAGWRRPAQAAGLPVEHVTAAIRTGLRYVGNEPAFRTVLIRAVAYVLAFSAVPALLAVYTREVLHGTATDYGLLLGALGVGGIAGALVLPGIRQRWSSDRIVVVATLVYAAAMAAAAALPALVPGVAAVGVTLLVAGLAGMANMSTFNIAGQSVLPDWVRGRGLAVVQLSFMLALAVGGAGWGTLATRIGVPATLSVAAGCLAATAVLARRLPLAATDAIDPTLSDLSEPYVPVTLLPDDGPVLLSVEYRIPPESLGEFLDTAHQLARMRRRDGAMHWALYTDPNDTRRLVETFSSPSWSEHLRGASRLTVADAQILERIRAFHDGGEEPRLTAMLAARTAVGH